MSLYHIRIEADEDWYVLQAVEDESIFSQARTLDEAVLMIRDVLDLMKNEKDAELRLIVPADLPVDDTRRSGRLTCWEPRKVNGSAKKSSQRRLRVRGNGRSRPTVRRR